MATCKRGHTGLIECPTCKGTGQAEARTMGYGPVAIAPTAQAACPSCKGSGYLEPHSCKG